MKNGINYCLIFLFATVMGFAQSPDILRVEYMTVPGGDSEVGYSRVKILGNVPLKGKSDHFFVVGVDYSGIKYTIPESLPFTNDDIENLHVIDLNIGYVYKWNEDWRLIGVITPRVASNFSEGWKSDDVFMNFTVGGFKEKKDIDKPYRLVLGIAYNSAAVVQIPLPVVYYEKFFHPNWSYILGVPKTGLKYLFKNKHLFQSEVMLDGHYANIQNGIVLPNTNVSAAVSSVLVLATLGYQYKFTKDISAYGVIGRTLWQDGVLRNNNREEVFALNKQPIFYFRTGFRIGL